ncbi:MAG: precorrin-8X methylmutase [Hyphomicrobiales bacterium]|nr:precorrin-8X methylmutase [Hyphomicrobiales bacterium]PCH51713.1 MAG: precorrin-8X methylmutase [Hyphomicrobiales bacterium]
MTFDYIKDPAEIYRQSFATVEREAVLDNLPDAMQRVAVRLVHSCGMVDVVDDLEFSKGAAEIGVDALKDGCAVFCDVEMVRSGIIEKNLPFGCETLCTLNDPRAAEFGKAKSTTRTAAGVDFWDERLAGSIVVIGNAPTALFRILERIDLGAPKPALIIGIPVGFVSVVESKNELIKNSRGIPFITVKGRRGGSAMACSVVNALSFLAQETN